MMMGEGGRKGVMRTGGWRDLEQVAECRCV